MAGEIGALLGRVVASKFRIEEHVGGGAMGEVFRARHVVLDTAIALKIMRPDIAKDATFKERFYREAKAASRLDHPNSVRVIDFGVEPDGLVYLAMEFLHGRDLLSVLREEWPLPDERVVDLLVQTLGAVSVAHDLGIVHRDLKPENIMVTVGHEDEGTRPYHVKVCDFGIAKLNDPRGFQTDSSKALTSSGTLIGTPEYMSPEQARGDPLDARSDIYSIGIVLYQLLVGRVPFSAENALGVVLKQVTDEPVPPSHVRPGVNARLEAICLRALRKPRDERYQSAKDMRRDLRGVFGYRPNATTEESGAHIPARRPLPSEDSSAPTIVQVVGATVVAPVASAKHLESTRDFASKHTSDGTEITVPMNPGQRWLGIIVAVAVLGLVIGATTVVLLARRGSAGPTAAGAGSASGGTSDVPSGVMANDDAPEVTSSPPLSSSRRAAPLLVATGGPPPSASGAVKNGAPVTAKLAPSAASAAAASASVATSPVASAGPAAGTNAGSGTGPAAVNADPAYNPAGAHVALGALSRERVREDVIRAKMSAALPQISECYRTALVMMGAPVGGSAEIHMSIDDKGNVTTFVNAPKLPPFARCVQRALGSQTVPVSALESSGAGATASQWLTLHP